MQLENLSHYNKITLPWGDELGARSVLIIPYDEAKVEAVQELVDSDDIRVTVW